MYLESLVLDFPIANKLINSAFVQVFLKLFVLDSIEMKARVCSIFGQLLRYATIIDSDLPKSLLVDNLLEIITQNSRSDEVTVKRKAIAALGEYLFYAATQMDDEEYDDDVGYDEYHDEQYDDGDDHDDVPQRQETARAGLIRSI